MVGVGNFHLLFLHCYFFLVFLKSLLSKLWKHEVKNQPKGYDCKHYYSGSTALQSENCFQLLPNCWDDLGGLFFLSPTWKLYHYFLGLKKSAVKSNPYYLQKLLPLWWVVYIAIPHTRTHWTIGIGKLTKAVRSGNHHTLNNFYQGIFIKIEPKVLLFHSLKYLRLHGGELFGKKGWLF